MTQGLAVRSTEPENYTPVEPCLDLLPEQEPGYRIFFRNFLDLILRRTEPPLFLASQPVHFRRHFYVRTGVHWMVVLESIVWHSAAVPLLLVFWALSLQWGVNRYPVQRSRIAQSERLTYYPPVESFPARAGRQSTELAPAHRKVSRQPAIHVAQEKLQPGIEPPNVTVSGGAPPEIASSNAKLPAVPLAATARSRLVLPNDLNEAIGPAPDTKQLAMRNVASPTASVIAPPPQVGGLGRRAGVNVPVTVVAPAPSMQGSVRLPRSGNFDIGASAVPPSPRLPMSAQRGGRGIGSGALAASGAAVVPPSPSIGRALILAAGRGDSLGTATQVVPPAPSIRGRIFLPNGGGSPGSGVDGGQVVPPSPALGGALLLTESGGNSFGGTGTAVVPPAPAIGSSGLSGHGNGGIKSFAGVVGFAVPPAPSIGTIAGQRGGTAASGIGGLGGNGAQVAGPIPSLAGAGLGSGGTGRGTQGNSFAASAGPQVLQPGGSGNGGQGGGLGGGNAPSGMGSQGLSGSMHGAGTGGAGLTPPSGAGGETVAELGKAPALGGADGTGQTSTPIISTAIPSRPQIPDVPAGKTQVLPLRVVQLALALPMSSYFSNYEAFLAERSVTRDTTQLIKLVYIFLPYQRRLTEFGVNTAKTFNLRVTRDPSCDESLLSMTWPEGETHKDRGTESSKNKLPCYRTTADDYRKAWEKSH